jgi:hypothetical protein
MSRVIKMSTPKPKQASLPKTAALTKAQAEHKAWLNLLTAHHHDRGPSTPWPGTVVPAVLGPHGALARS